MPRIPTYVAPEQQLRPSQTGAAALETAGRRINPLYQSIAENDRRQGEINVQQYKELLWPRDIVKLYEDRSKQNNQGIRVRLVGGVNPSGDSGFGGTTETFSTDPTQDFGPGPRGHGQVSRGAGALGRALSDGGSALSSGYRPGSEETDYTGNQDYYGAYSYNPSPAQISLDKYNQKMDAAVQAVTDQAVATRDYWTQYYGGRGSQYQTDQTYNQAIRDSVRSTAAPPVPDSTSGGFSWGGLGSFISGTDNTSQSSTTDTGM